MEQKINKTVIEQIYNDCTLNLEDIKNVDLTPYVVFEGISYRTIINKEKIESYSEIIELIISQIKNIEDGILFDNMNIDINNNIWGDLENIEKLIILGIASGNLSYFFKKEDWVNLPNGRPALVKTKRY